MIHANLLLKSSVISHFLKHPDREGDDDKPNVFN